MKKIIALLLLVLCSVIALVRAMNNVEINQKCFDYLELAASASSPQIALIHLKKATKYLEQISLTSGYTSIIYKTRDENIGFWYNNLKQSEAQLEKVTAQTSAVEKSNLLSELRKTLLDQSNKDTILKTPPGLAVYPNNKLWVISIFVICITAVGLIISVFMHLNRIHIYDEYFKYM